MLSCPLHGGQFFAHDDDGDRLVGPVYDIELCGLPPRISVGKCRAKHHTQAWTIGRNSCVLFTTSKIQEGNGHDMCWVKTYDRMRVLGKIMRCAVCDERGRESSECWMCLCMCGKCVVISTV